MQGWRRNREVSDLECARCDGYDERTIVKNVQGCAYQPGLTRSQWWCLMGCYKHFGSSEGCLQCIRIKLCWRLDGRHEFSCWLLPNNWRLLAAASDIALICNFLFGRKLMQLQASFALTWKDYWHEINEYRRFHFALKERDASEVVWLPRHKEVRMQNYENASFFIANTDWMRANSRLYDAQFAHVQQPEIGSSAEDALMAAVGGIKCWAIHRA